MVCVYLQAQRTYTTHSAAWCPVDTRACRDVMHPLTRIVKWLSMCARPCICAMTLKTASRAIRALIPACINRYRLHYVLIPVFACSCTELECGLQWSPFTAHRCQHSASILRQRLVGLWSLCRLCLQYQQLYHRVPSSWRKHRRMESLNTGQ